MQTRNLQYNSHNYPSYNHNYPSSRGQYNPNNNMPADMGDNKVSEITSPTQDSWNQMIGQPRNSAEEFIMSYQLRENSPQKGKENASYLVNKNQGTRAYRRQPSVDRIEDDDSFIHFNQNNINSVKLEKKRSQKTGQKIKLQSLIKNTNKRSSDLYKQSFRHDQMRVILQSTKQQQPSLMENTCVSIRQFFSSISWPCQQEQDKLMDYMEKQKQVQKQTERRRRDQSDWRC